VIAHGSVDALGNLAANYHVVKPTRFTVIYAGDGQYNKRRASASVLPTTVTPPVVLPPVEQRTTIAVENEIGALVSLRFSNELGNQTVVSHPGEIGDPFTLPNIPLPVNDIWMTVLAGADGGSTLTGGFFTPGHSYIVRVVWDPSSTHWVTLEQVAVS
jgi:hypothetical protein